MAKTGARIEIRGFAGGIETWEPARLARITKAMRPLPAGFHPVTFDRDGARLLVHESRIRLAEVAP